MKDSGSEGEEDPGSSSPKDTSEAITVEAQEEETFKKDAANGLSYEKLVYFINHMHPRDFIEEGKVDF